MNEHFDKLFKQIDSMKKQTPWNDYREGQGTYNSLDQAIYHLCQCRNLVENFSERPHSRAKQQRTN